ncbi:MAG: 4Fe-4S binding protein [Dehalococcoidia bacterium]|nr:MAG: 4Fe-4S binding protein [Dehalococcoidia bacterium]
MLKLELTPGRKAAAWSVTVALFSAWWYLSPYPWLGLAVGLVTGLLTFGMLSSGRIERFRQLLFIAIPVIIILTLAGTYLLLGNVQFMQWVARWDPGYYFPSGGGTGTIVYPGPVVLPAIFWRGAEFLTQFDTWQTSVPRTLLAFFLFMIPYAIIFLVFGRAFCGWICPLGGLSEFGAAAGRQWMRLNFLRIRVESPDGFYYAGLKPWVQAIKYVFALAIVLMSFMLGFALINIFFPVLWLKSVTGFWIVMGILAVFAVALPLVTGRRWWCFICPVAAVLARIDRISPFKIKINPEKCVKCLDCVEACRMYALSPGDVENGGLRGGHCVKCGRCIEACSEKAVDICWMEGKRKVRAPFLATIISTTLVLYTWYVVLLASMASRPGSFNWPW